MKDDRIDKLVDIIMPVLKELEAHISQCNEFQSNTNRILGLLKDAIMLEKELKK